VTEIVVEGDHHTTDDRLATVRNLLLDYERSIVAQAAA
jgi:hypothetical protein